LSSPSLFSYEYIVQYIFPAIFAPQTPSQETEGSRT
jgi:hypothetical protein